MYLNFTRIKLRFVLLYTTGN